MRLVRDVLDRSALPDQAPVVARKRHHEESLLDRRDVRRPLACLPLRLRRLQRGRVGAGIHRNRGHHEDSFSEHHRRRQAATGNGHLETDVAVLRPLDGRVAVGADPVERGAAPVGPVSGLTVAQGRAHGEDDGEREQYSKHDPRRYEGPRQHVNDG